MLKNILLILLVSTCAFSQSIDERRKQIIEIIDEELSEVNRLSQTTSRNRADYLLRSAELYLEKARVWKEKENEDYLASPNSKRRKINKARFFKRSGSYFSQARRKCVEITKKYPRYSGISDVYYILGYYAKEMGRNKSATKYFSLARRKSKKSSVTRVKSNISLAEVYYNQNKFSKAIPLYESALKSHKDKWWTKDSFNLAWSYFKINSYTKAIQKMREIHQKSSDSKFVDMKSQVERDIGLFYATSGRITEGIEFYKKLGINFTDQLIKIGQLLSKQGALTRAKTVLEQAIKYEKNDKKRVEIYIEQLKLYSTFSRDGSHLLTSEDLFKLFEKKIMSDREVKVFNYEMRKNSAKLQKQVASKTYKSLPKKRKYKANLAKAYFSMLEKTDSQNALEHRFLRGETNYSISLYSTALADYWKVFKAAEKLNNKEYKVKSMDGVLSCLGKRSISSKTKNAYYAPVYSNYVVNFPNTKKTPSIYRKLFKVYMDEPDLKKAKIVIDRYNLKYPSDLKNREAMIATLMDRHRKNKDNNSVKQWITDIDAGKYIVSAQYSLKLRELLTSMQINVVQGMLKSGNKKAALIGYHKILKDPHSTKRSKINAKYNLAALYYELGDMKKAYHWSVQSLKDMSPEDVNGFSDSFLTISSYLFLKMQFLASADLSERVVAKLCTYKTRKKEVAFKNSLYLYFSENKISKAESLIKLGARCRLPDRVLVDAKVELAKEYLKYKKYEDLEIVISELTAGNSNLDKTIPFIYELYQVNKNFNNSIKATRYYKLIQMGYAEHKKRKNYPLEALNVFAEFEINKLLAKKRQLEAVELSFPEKVFNSSVQRKLTMMDAITKNAVNLQSIGSTIGIVASYNILIDSLKHTISSVDGFTPPGKSEDYVKSLKKSLAPLLNSFRQTLKKAQSEAIISLESNKILTSNNSTLLENARGIPMPFYLYEKGSVIMNKRGNK